MRPFYEYLLLDQLSLRQMLPEYIYLYIIIYQLLLDMHLFIFLSRGDKSFPPSFTLLFWQVDRTSNRISQPTRLQHRNEPLPASRDSFGLRCWIGCCKEKIKAFFNFLQARTAPMTAAPIRSVSPWHANAKGLSALKIKSRKAIPPRKQTNEESSFTHLCLLSTFFAPASSWFRALLVTIAYRICAISNDSVELKT